MKQIIDKNLEKLAIKTYPVLNKKDWDHNTFDINQENREAFIKGYNANSKNFTEKDIVSILTFIKQCSDWNIIPQYWLDRYKKYINK